jgi:hypothetical protein
MGPSWLVRSVGVSLAILAATACEPPFVERGFGVWFRNGADVPVIVQFVTGGYGVGYLVSAGEIGGSYLGLGPMTWSARVRIVTNGCYVLWDEVVKDAPSGSVVVAADMSVRLVTSGAGVEPDPSEVPIPAARETGNCLPKGIEYSPSE